MGTVTFSARAFAVTFQLAMVTSSKVVSEPKLTVLFLKMTDILVAAGGRFRVVGDGTMRVSAMWTDTGYI